MTDFSKLNPRIPCKNCLMWVMCQQRTLLKLKDECDMFSEFLKSEGENYGQHKHTM